MTEKPEFITANKDVVIRITDPILALYFGMLEKIQNEMDGIALVDLLSATVNTAETMTKTTERLANPDEDPRMRFDVFSNTINNIATRLLGDDVRAPIHQALEPFSPKDVDGDSEEEAVADGGRDQGDLE